MENNKLKKFTCCFIMLILVLSLYGCGVSSEQVKDAVANTVIKKCESYGLRNVSIAVSGGEKDDAGFQIFHMTVISSNFDSLSYEQMFAFEKELDKTIFGAVGTIGDRIIVTENYESNGDTWNVYESTIYKNGERIYERFTNKYGTATTKCVVNGCNSYIASSGDTNCCVLHSNKCIECNKYIDGDALFCMDCIKDAMK